MTDQLSTVNYKSTSALLGSSTGHGASLLLDVVGVLSSDSGESVRMSSPLSSRLSSLALKSKNQLIQSSFIPLINNMHALSIL